LPQRTRSKRFPPESKAFARQTWPPQPTRQQSEVRSPISSHCSPQAQPEAKREWLPKPYRRLHVPLKREGYVINHKEPFRRSGSLGTRSLRCAAVAVASRRSGPGHR
jgi:hypothetical protein